MIDELIRRTQSAHSQEQISQDDYDAWCSDPVTRRFMEGLELSMLTQAFDDVTDQHADRVLITACTRAGAVDVIQNILGWSPEGLLNAEEKRELNDED